MKITNIIVVLFFIQSMFAQKITSMHNGVLFKCKLDNNGLIVTSFDTDADTVIVPSVIEYKGVIYPVKEISTFINGNNYLARYLELSEGIERISKFSFNEFRKLSTVKLPTSIKYIGKNAFRKTNHIHFILPDKMNESNVWDWRSMPQDKHGSKSTISQLQKDDSNERINKQNIVAQDFSSKTNKYNDVDNNIPITTLKNEHTYCVVIANENYQDAPTVECAANDGQIFSKYCNMTLGIPLNQIRVYYDAGYTDIIKAIRFLESVQQFDQDAKLILYYSGHGIPNEKDKSAYLLPSDGSPKEMQTCISLKSLYERLGKIQSNNVLILLDACFCGTNRGKDDAILASRSIVRVKEEAAMGNMIIMTAASADETAFALKEARHGLFTYHLLKELKQNKGKIKLGELYNSIKTNVAKTSVIENDKLQSPTVIYSPSIKNSWEDFYF